MRAIRHELTFLLPFINTLAYLFIYNMFHFGRASILPYYYCRHIPSDSVPFVGPFLFIGDWDWGIHIYD